MGGFNRDSWLRILRALNLLGTIAVLNHGYKLYECNGSKVVDCNNAIRLFRALLYWFNVVLLTLNPTNDDLRGNAVLRYLYSQEVVFPA